MKKVAALTAVLLGLMTTAPALGAETPLMLVVSDFDAALQRSEPDAEAPAAASADSGSRELEQILALLRQTRAPRVAPPAPTTARPH